MVQQLDPAGLTDAQLFAVGRLVHLREGNWGDPFVPGWTIEAPLGQPPHSLKDDALQEAIAPLVAAGWVDVPPREGGAPAEESDSQYMASDRAMQARDAVRTETAGRAGPVPEELGAQLLLFDAGGRPAGFARDVLERAFEEAPSSLPIEEARRLYAKLMDKNWLHYVEREDGTNWFPSPKAWACWGKVRDLLHERLPEMRERLVDGIVALHGIPEGAPLHAALRAIDRAAFVGEDWRIEAYRNMPVPVAFDDNGNQATTTSQPAVCAMIAQTLDLRQGDRVLVAGAKGGFTAALCAHLVGKGGRVVCTETNPLVAEHARSAIERAGIPDIARRVDVRLVRDVTVGIEDSQSWDAVVINGKIPKVPRPIIRQMVDGGRLLIFLQGWEDEAQTAYLIRKNGSAIANESLSNFLFTPVYGEFGFDPPNWQEDLDLIGQAPHDVFVSYSTRDQEHCDALVGGLEDAGIRCWYSARNHPVGRDGYGAAIMQAIRDAKVFVLLLSHESLESHHVQNELENATNHKRQVLPIRLAECPRRLPEGFQYHLGRWQQYDLESHTHAAVAEAILKLLGGERARPQPTRRPGSPEDPGIARRTPMDGWLDLVLDDGHVTRAEMGMLVEKAIADGLASDEAGARAVVARMLRERRADATFE